MQKNQVSVGTRYAYVAECDPQNGSGGYYMNMYLRDFAPAREVECLSLKSQLRGGVRVRFIDTGEERDISAAALHMEWHAHEAHVIEMREGERLEAELTDGLTRAAEALLGPDPDNRDEFSLRHHGLTHAPTQVCVTPKLMVSILRRLDQTPDALEPQAASAADGTEASALESLVQ